MTTSVLPIVFSALDGGIDFAGLWGYSLALVIVLGAVHFASASSLELLSRKRGIGNPGLAYVPVANVIVLSGLARNRFDVRNAVPVAVGACLLLAALLFGWYGPMENFFVNWILSLGAAMLLAGLPSLGALNDGYERTGPGIEDGGRGLNRYLVAVLWLLTVLLLLLTPLLALWMTAGVLLSIAYGILWVRLAEMTGQDEWLGWLAATPFLGVLGQWTIASQAPWVQQP